eukprot:22597-Rhodomonas_salina.1
MSSTTDVSELRAISTTAAPRPDVYGSMVTFDLITTQCKTTGFSEPTASTTTSEPIANFDGPMESSDHDKGKATHSPEPTASTATAAPTTPTLLATRATPDSITRTCTDSSEPAASLSEDVCGSTTTFDLVKREATDSSNLRVCSATYDRAWC